MSYFHDVPRDGAYSRRSGSERDKHDCHTPQHIGEEGGSDIGFIGFGQCPIRCSLCCGYLVQCPPTRASGSILDDRSMHGKSRRRGRQLSNLRSSGGRGTFVSCRTSWRFDHLGLSRWGGGLTRRWCLLFRRHLSSSYSFHSLFTLPP